MASKWGRISDRVRLGLFEAGPGPGMPTYRSRPRGVNSGRWMLIGPVWLRLGRRKSWAAEDLDAEMVEPVEPVEPP